MRNRSISFSLYPRPSVEGHAHGGQGIAGGQRRHQAALHIGDPSDQVGAAVRTSDKPPDMSWMPVNDATATWATLSIAVLREGELVPHHGATHCRIPVH
jgi:hypothetical protein